MSPSLRFIIDKLNHSNHPCLLLLELYCIERTVALIAQSGGCSITEKAQVAANMINPANNVQYLIIQDSNKRGHKYKYHLGELVPGNYVDDDDDDDGGVGDNSNIEKSQFISRSNSHHVSTSELVPDLLHGDDGVNDKFYFEYSEQLEQHRMLMTHPTTDDNKNLDGGGSPNSNNINLAVLDVSYAAGQALFNLILNEDPIDHRQGG